MIRNQPVQCNLYKQYAGSGKSDFAGGMDSSFVFMDPSNIIKIKLFKLNYLN